MLKRQEMDMTTGVLWKKIVIFAFPVFLTNLLQILYNAADMVVVGRFAKNGDAALAAVGATSSLYHLIINLFIGLGIGVNAVSALHIGASEKEKVKNTIVTSFVIAVICGIIIAIGGYFLIPAMLEFMKTDPEVIDSATLYLRIVLFAAPITLLFNFGSAVFRAIGDTQRPLVFLGISGALNIVLNLFFVIVLKMGVAGVAISTVISQLLSAILVWYCLSRDDAYYRFDFKEIRVYKEELRKIIFIGVPSGIQSCMFSFSNVILQSTVNSFGKSVMAGAAASSSIEGILDTVSSAVTNATLTFTSQNMGARKFDRIKSTLLSSIVIVTVAVGVLSVPLVSFRDFFISLYNPNPEVIKNGATRLLINGSTYVVNAYMCCFAAFMRGMGYSMVPMYISIFDIVVLRLFYLWVIYPNIEQSFFNLMLLYPITWTLTAFMTLIAAFIYMKKVKTQFALSLQ